MSDSVNPATSWPNPLRELIDEIARGRAGGNARIMHAIGERDSIGTTANGEDLWRGNELSAVPSAPASHLLIPTPPDAGEQMTVISESVEDVAGGDGADTIAINYLDANGAEQTTPLTMNGTTAVDVTPSDVRFVQSMYVTALGSGNLTGVAEGNIRIYKKADDTLVYNMIAAGGNMSLVPHRMVPAGKVLLPKWWSAGEQSANKRGRIRLRADCTDGPTCTRQAGVFLFKAAMALNASAFGEPLALTIPALSILKASAWAQTAACEMGVNWWGVLRDA